MKKIYLCFFNRKDVNNNKNFNIGSVIDLYLKLNQLCNSNNYELIKTDQIQPGEINFIIEDFKVDHVDHINSIKKKNPSTKIILFLTEFFTTVKDITTLNTFHLNEKNLNLYRSLFNFWESYIQVRSAFEIFRKFIPYFFNFIFRLNLATIFVFISKTIVPLGIYNKMPVSRVVRLEHLIKILITCLFLNKSLPLTIALFKFKKSLLNKNFLLTIKNDLLFYYRYLSLKSIEKNIDLVIKSHPEIHTGKLFKDTKSFIIYFNSTKKLEYIDFQNKNIDFFEFSGEMSTHRKNLILDLIENLKIDDQIEPVIKNKILKSLVKLHEIELGFYDIDLIENKKKKQKKYIFQIHPKKTKEWSFSSPTRYYRSLEKNIIPITFISDNISDETTKFFTLEIDDFNQFLKNYISAPKNIVDDMNIKIAHLNDFAETKNQELFSYIKNLK